MTTAVDDWEREIGQSVDVVETPLGVLVALVRERAAEIRCFTTRWSQMNWAVTRLGLLFVAMAERRRSEKDLWDFLELQGRNLLVVTPHALAEGLGHTSIDFQMRVLRKMLQIKPLNRQEEEDKSDGETVFINGKTVFIEVVDLAEAVFLEVLGGHCEAGRMEEARRLMELWRSVDINHSSELSCFSGDSVRRLFSNGESIRMFREAGWEWPLVKSAPAGDLKYLMRESPVADAPLRAKAAASLFHRPEWQMLFLDEAEYVIDRSYLLNKTPRMRQAFEADDGALFMVELALQGRRITKGMVQTLVLKEKSNILQELIRKPKEFAKAYPPGKLLFLLLDGVCLSKRHRGIIRLEELRGCSYADSCMTVVRSLEQAFPGVVKNARDGHGVDALWHLLHGVDALWHLLLDTDVLWHLQHSPLEELLISLGCDPNRQIEALGGLSYAQVSEAFWEMAAQEAEQG